MCAHGSTPMRLHFFFFNEYWYHSICRNLRLTYQRKAVEDFMTNPRKLAHKSFIRIRFIIIIKYVALISVFLIINCIFCYHFRPFLSTYMSNKLLPHININSTMYVCTIHLLSFHHKLIKNNLCRFENKKTYYFTNKIIETISPHEEYW